MQGRKMQDRKMRHQTARVENAGLENAGPICRGGKCGTIECGKLVCCLQISVPKLMLECKNDIGFSSFDTVVSNSCTICFVFIYVFSICVFDAFRCLYVAISQNFNGRSYLK